jgi:hypothetical protein
MRAIAAPKPAVAPVMKTIMVDPCNGWALPKIVSVNSLMG